ncbi:putative ABC transporter ATP-binding protein YfiB [Virgibacillus pantothenticus]|uniref:ABC transporter ATP-binding protein n=1 Tax=Virgibacillus pantothenticus TaxID=1473 RepID=UPI001B1A7F0C|nr:ABC transporter ATP-binding protein [Virgibacillus pantothenticus]MBU8566730.1 ABC transporter ATP-binding protein/permease [Virgibacillus pantothenticus]MBU8600313.1 ABC transporter ATP-binding protein/permease [Virgibacillus pantothenticus]MBU8634886.1 ABC transporter ATP-binding protein/permease [Virgibacillus pantothenticus]MBU8642450.1 ABC transporter ATP-binding protein/permease [Virgibacillus pantothenticus]MBU8646598.1 ABC transporter ATP-binding protein/permease [Virgibacillus pant
MKTVLAFLKPYKLPASLAFMLMLVELAVELLLPFLLGKMINEGVVNQDLSTILVWGSIMIGLALIAFIAGIVNSFYASHVSWRFAYDLREKLFAKIQAFSFAHLNQYPTSALMTRFTNDIRQMQNTIYMMLRIMSKAPLIVIGGVTMAFVVNAKLALIFLISVPLLVVFVLWVLKVASKLFHQVQKSVDKLNQVMQENLSGMRLIKAFSRRNYEQERFKEANQSLADKTKSTFRFVEASMPVLLFVMNISLLFIIWFGNSQVTAGSTNVGDVVAIINYALRVSMSISMFTFIIMAFSRMRASTKRVSDILRIETDLQSTKTADTSAVINQGAISFQQIHFTYPEHDKSVLHGVSFNIKSGEKLAVMGATGAGKTSLFQLIPRLYDASSGTITIDNKDITTYPLDQLRNSIGYVPQSPLLFTGTIKENITWGKPSATSEEMIQAAKDAQIHETILQLEQQYETKVGQKGVNLSGGQKQRISIARALIRKPKILMLDDSTSALDLTTEAHLLEAIDTYHCTTLIITQKVSTAMRADRILLLDNGKILALGTHQSLLESSKLYQRIVASQFGKEVSYAK